MKNADDNTSSFTLMVIMKYFYNTNNRLIIDGYRKARTGQKHNKVAIKAEACHCLKKIKKLNTIQALKG